MTSRGYNKAIHKPNKETPTQKIGPNSDNSRDNDRFSSVTSTLQTCMGFVDGLCCANLNHVSAEDQEERRRDNLRNFVTSYDLSYLNSNVGDPNNNTGDSGSDSHSSSPEKEDFMPPPASKSMTPSVEKGTTHHVQNATLMHTVLPSSMLPREYGHSRSTDTGIREHKSSSCCHSFQQFHGFDEYGGCQHDSQYAQPHTLQSADTYTTVSLSQSYTTMMWDDDDDDEEEDDASCSDYTLSPVDSVFRKDERMEEASVEHSGAPACSPPSFPTSDFANKTHEAYQYLLRMKPQNYLHGSGSSGELATNYCHSNHTMESSSTIDVNQCGPLFLQ